MFKTRLLSGIVLVVLIFGILYFGGYVTALAIFLLAIIGNYELLKVYGLEKKGPGILTYAATTVYYCFLVFGLREYVLPVMLLFVLLVLSLYVIRYPLYRDRDAMAAILTFFYVSVMLSYVYLIRDLKHGGAFVIMIFVCSWVNDTFAYCFGVTMGKHKMTPKLSPKKSIEGLIGGLFSSTVVGALYGIFFSKNVYELDKAPLIFAIVGLAGAIMAVIGDLAASAIKRNNDIKDYGRLIPGHGGVLDRFDSIIFTAPIIYYCLLFMAGNIGG